MIKNIIFMLKIFFVLITELSIYFVFNDFVSFIERLTNKLASINILYVKFFQAIALNNNLIDDNINNKLIKFTDNAPWNYNDIRYEELITIANDYNIVLPFGYETPINSGMISLVFKGYKKDTNESVIIKVKRKNIDKQLNESIDNLLFFIKTLSFIPFIKKYRINEVVTKNINIIKQQTDFRIEVNNMIKMKTNCKNLKYVKIPYVYKEVTEANGNFIVMEFIKGETIKNVKEEDYDEFAKQVLKFGFVTTLIHGVLHADLHSGNILFVKDESDEKYKHKIGVIDFGIIYELNENYKNNLFDVMSDIFSTPCDLTARKILYSGVLEPLSVIQNLDSHHVENIVSILANVIKECVTVKKKASQTQLYNFFTKLTNYLNQNDISNLGLKPSDDLVKSQLVLAMSHGVSLSLCKSDFASVANKVLNELFHTELLDE